MKRLRRCIECKERRVSSEEDEICKVCWDASIFAANFNRLLKIELGYTVDKTGAVVKP